ncbi:sigma-54 dependent transcriptional regulator [Pelagibacterium flavum]|uniref:Sigma-54 dependent transcriptional regulator n=1 Tax=Pelagibacterium flavum TaxID=2984530 RepID=A0ABY6IQQ4_9HYPH|nr:sigma-54 dependent transcriptional regulator [Pelagibacterium sp. YIM 151497]UYQ71550.1 sigma-54 dependent transcriptional regulator [Pelagibacterium sp. YIM 151497]
MRDGTPSDADVNLLLIECSPERARATMSAIYAQWGQGITLVHCTSGQQAMRNLKAQRFDVLLAETGSLEGLGGGQEAAFGALAAASDDALIIALSDGGSVSLAVAAMRAGAHDYLPLPVSGPVLAARLGELGQRHGKARAMVCDTLVEKHPDFEGFVGTTPQMQAIYDQILRIAPSAAPVFITGESGTGKEVTAEALHKRSPRAKKRFIAINAGAIPRELMESEVFGAVKGSYTGAHEDRKGAIEMADGGTLFLDEVGEMDLALQSKLLRFLQTGTITRVGESVARPVDVRVICATNRNPMQLVSEKKFREDLFYRLHVLPIHLPPLRQRPGDIMPLAQSFLASFAKEEGKGFVGFAPDVADLFVAREWPGNVRQLQNLVRRIVVMFDGGMVTSQMAMAADIESRDAYDVSVISTGPLPDILPMWQQEQKIIEDALGAFGGNIARAAAALEISPSTIYRKRLGWERAGAA